MSSTHQPFHENANSAIVCGESFSRYVERRVALRTTVAQTTCLRATAAAAVVSFPVTRTRLLEVTETQMNLIRKCIGYAATQFCGQ